MEIDLIYISFNLTHTTFYQVNKILKKKKQ